MSIFSKLGEKSWATPGYTGPVGDRSRGTGPAARTMLGFLLAVLTSMFFLFFVGNNGQKLPKHLLFGPAIYAFGGFIPQQDATLQIHHENSQWGMIE